MGLFIRTAIKVHAIQVTEEMFEGGASLPPGLVLEDGRIHQVGEVGNCLLFLADRHAVDSWLVDEDTGWSCVDEEYFYKNFEQVGRLEDVPPSARSVRAPARSETAEDPPPQSLDDALREIKVLRQERDGWIKAARYYASGDEFYRDLLDKCAGYLGVEAFTNDEGFLCDTPLRIKIPSLVSRLAAQAGQRAGAKAQPDPSTNTQAATTQSRTEA